MLIDPYPTHILVLLTLCIKSVHYVFCMSPEPASDGVFSIALLGKFDQALSGGPWGYRRLMAEAGLIGQVLYLEAETFGLQGTGIGCFIDDGLHELFGLKDKSFQVLYQFTVGRAETDLRITNEPAYPGLEA